MKGSLLILLSMFQIMCLKQSTYAQHSSIINTRLIDSSQYWIGHPQGDLTRISANGQIGLINKEGKLICEPEYDRIFNFYNGVAVVTKDGKYGAIDLTGKELVVPKLPFISDFKYGMAWFSDESYSLWGLLDLTGEVLHEASLSGIRKYQNEQFAFLGDRLLHSSGKIIHQLELEAFAKATGDRSNLSNSEDYVMGQKVLQFLAEQRQTNQAGYFDLKEAPKTLLFYYNSGFALFPQSQEGVVRVGYLDKKGKVVIGATYENAQQFIGKSACVKKGGLWGAINKKGKEVIPTQYEYLKSTSSSCWIFKKAGKYGVMDASGKEILSPEYLEVKHLFDHVFAVLHEGESSTVLVNDLGEAPLDMRVNTWGVINAETGEQIVPANAHRVVAIEDNFGIAMTFDLSTGEDEGMLQVGSATSIPRETSFTGKAVCRLFNGAEVMSEFTTPEFELEGLDRGREAQLERINPLRKVNDYYRTGNGFINAFGIEVSEASLIEQLQMTMNEALPVLFVNPNSKKQGCKGPNGKEILSAEYETIKIVDSGIIASKSGKWKYYDLLGKELIPLIYDKIESTHSGLLKVQSGKDSFLINHLGVRMN